MRVQEIMTRDVIHVRPGTPIREVARLLVANGISGVPVCSADGSVLGVVSEADILRKEEGVSSELPRFLAWICRHLDGELDKIGAHTAGEAMTSPALVVRPLQPVSRVARLMIDRNINRAPVVSDGRLVGIVTRADLMRAFARSDVEIEHEIRKEVLFETMLLAPGDVDVSVEGGRVRLSGRLRCKSDAEILERCVRRVPGVLDIETDLRWTAPPAAGTQRTR